MKYLLDVNVLVALGIRQHQFHERISYWIQAQARIEGTELLTCSITELGFVRVVANVAQYSRTVEEAKSLLIRARSAGPVRFRFIADDRDTARLPLWVKAASQVTDGHLVELAKVNGGLLATLDEKIPNAYYIPRAT